MENERGESLRALLDKKVAEIQERAKLTAVKDVHYTLTSGGHYSLEDVINTKEKADLFMYMLRMAEK